MYSKGKWNLSRVPYPPCLKTKGFISAPECYSERKRTAEVEPLLRLKHWDDSDLFKCISSRIRKKQRVAGLTISLIHENKVHVKYETRLDFREVPRSVSLDSHALLSKDCLYLLDASKDWRTSKNPLVVGRPNIRLYCGVRIMSPKGEPVGVLAVFDTYARHTRQELLVNDLHSAAREIMGILQTPYEKILEERKNSQDSIKPGKPTNEVDEELKQLSLKLGRATSKACAMTVFEKDGSGNPYSQNHHFALNAGDDNEDIKNNCLDEKQRKSLIRMLRRIGSLRPAAEMLCESLAASFKADFVFIVEIRSAELYSVAAEYFPKGHNKVDSEMFKHANKLVKSKRVMEETDRVLTRVLGTYGCTYLTIKSDHDFLIKAFLSDFGLQYNNPKHSTRFNSGCVMPFYRYNSKLVKKSSRNPDSNNIELYLRAGGYLVGVMNESSDKSQFPQATLSKIFDHMSVLRKRYIS